jgi:hypothetical protein
MKRFLYWDWVWIVCVVCACTASLATLASAPAVAEPAGFAERQARATEESVKALELIAQEIDELRHAVERCK